MDTKLGVHRVQQGDAKRFVRCNHVAARWAGLLALAAVSSIFVGCAAEAEVAPAPAVPVDYYYYPYTYYDGHIVYYVHGDWYYPYGNRWYYYRSAPPGLAHYAGPMHQYRSPYYQAAPYARPQYRAPAAPPYRPAPRAHGGGPRR